MDARILQAETDGVLIGLRRLAAGDVDRVTGGTEGRNEFAERSVEIGRHLHQLNAVIDAGVRQENA